MGRVEILDGGSDSDTDQVPEIKINEEYARRLEHNKKREELHRFEEMKKRGEVADSDSDSDSDSTEDEEEIIRESSKKKKLELLDALLKVKNQDPCLRNKHVQLFKSDDDDEQKPRVQGGDNDDAKSKKKEKLYLKDVNARHLMEQGPELDDDDDADVRNTTTRAKNIRVYDEDQEKLRKEFLSAVADEEDDEGELIIEKGKNAVDEDDDDDDAELDAKLNQCFPDEDENARFLKDYIKNEWWREDKCGGGATQVADADEEDLSEDEVEIERQEEYEYRFQEKAGDRILGHSRQVEGSVRKKDSARKKQRQSKEERMEIAKAEREEELRHLKNLKKKDNSAKLKKIMEIAGIEDGDLASFDPKDLDKEFDPQEYDRMMNKAFGQEYYEAPDADLEFGSDSGDIDKPDFHEEDELLGLPKGWDTVGSADGFLAARNKALKLKESVGDHEEESEEEEEEQESEEEESKEGESEEEVEEGKQEKKRKFALLDRAKKEMMDEYYKLDYEDTIEDLKTRFKYAKIKPNRFGLTTSEILVLDEKELNQYVSLKKLAPYAEKEWKAPNNKRMEMKEKFKEIAVGLGKKGNKKNQKKQRVSVDAKPSSSSTHPAGQSSTNASENGKEQPGGSNGDTGKKSRGSRWRKKQAAQKLSPARLKSYGLS